MTSYFLTIFILGTHISTFTFNMHQKIIAEYPPEYCVLLETIYGNGMMSEGQGEATEFMFEGVNLKGKKALDFGCGLGGMAQYLAETHDMTVIGVDINPWMIEEARKRIPDNLQTHLSYEINDSDERLVFPDHVFDIVYSKGVLTHIASKEKLFREFNRILKPGGMLVITDPISCVYNSWGPRMSKMIDIEGLTIFAESKESYTKLINQTDFNLLDMRDDSLKYQQYNELICEQIKTYKKELVLNLIGEENYDENLKGYQSLADAFKEGELIMLRIIAQKKKDVDQMEWTEFSCIIKPSPLGGVGVFATHDIPKDTIVFNQNIKQNLRVLKIKDVSEEHLKYSIYINDEECLCPERFDRMEIGWYLNHSADPNIAKKAPQNMYGSQAAPAFKDAQDFYDKRDKNPFYAIKDIKAGDEILIDYNYLNEPEHLKEDYYQNSSGVTKRNC